MYACMYVSMYECMYVCMYICMYSCRWMSVLTMMITTIGLFVCIYSYRWISVVTMMITTIGMYVCMHEQSNQSMCVWWSIYIGATKVKFPLTKRLLLWYKWYSENLCQIDMNKILAQLHCNIQWWSAYYCDTYQCIGSHPRWSNNLTDDEEWWCSISIFCILGY